MIREALMRGVAGIAAAVDSDLARRLSGMNVARRRGISQVVAAMLTVRGANLVELGNVLPREIASWEKRYQFVERVLGNAKTSCDAVMASFAGQVAGALAAAGETLIVMMDQSHINDLNEVLMVPLGFRGRALPLAWRVKSTKARHRLCSAKRVARGGAGDASGRCRDPAFRRSLLRHTGAGRLVRGGGLGLSHPAQIQSDTRA